MSKLDYQAQGCLGRIDCQKENCAWWIKQENRLDEQKGVCTIKLLAEKK